MADKNSGAEMPPLELVEVEQLPWTEWSKQEEIIQTQKQSEAIVMSETKDKHQTEEHKILAKVIRYICM